MKVNKWADTIHKFKYSFLTVYQLDVIHFAGYRVYLWFMSKSKNNLPFTFVFDI